MKIEIKNSEFKPTKIKSLFDYFTLKDEKTQWEYFGLVVELDPTIDFKGNNALIRWFNVKEGFNDKIIVNSLKEFNLNFKEIHD